MNPGIFREYDIRGIAEKDFDIEDVTRIGKAMGTHMVRNGCKTIAVGRDCRSTSEAYQAALIQGLTATGMDVIEIGVCPTPVLYFATHHLKTDAGIIVTASHNPPEYNGFKATMAGASLFGEALQTIRKIAASEDFVPGSQTGAVSSADPLPAYMDFIMKDISLKKPMKVVVDAGNGTGGVVALPLLRALGCEVTPLFCDMDGSFPNHEADPTIAANLQDLIRTVKETGADVGIGYDGDADRIGVVGPDGRIFHGDQLMILFSRDILKTRPGATFISEVKCSQTLYEDIARNGGNPIMWRTGHSLIKQKMKETGAVLAGEMSGHMFFADRYFGYDDAIYATCRLLEILSSTEKTLNDLLADVPETFNTPEIRVDCEDDKKFDLVRAVTAHYKKTHNVIDIDGARVLFEEGWGLVRASNTQPALVLRFEGKSTEARDAIRREMEEKVRTFSANP
ncbi:phosphomannomutase/phosphoglucomutase [Desulfobotulus sp.]|jgi:phosphomannomutase/phosphoglucomutase|uniref:phosphomannomutase/phosphoglucomutase n=1 Tax=Desulfobotulus sp. TaxID=1940337 RepID=UPI002A359C8A|nr:phosphomannomutase/phosphoglucomutase [Desulfobotulus sp.]MDY0163968.1 phosphomannomutase/phosphoglucomutase [Desulfobotulus sp.]